MKTDSDIQSAISIALKIQSRLGHFTQRDLANALIAVGVEKYRAHTLADLTIQSLEAKGAIDWESVSWFGREYVFQSLPR